MWQELDAFYEFFKVDVVAAIGRFQLAPDFWAFFFCMESIKECQLVGDEEGTEVELKSVEPIFRLFVNGIVPRSHFTPILDEESGVFLQKSGVFLGF